MNKLSSEKEQLLQKLILDYDRTLNIQILRVCSIYILLSLSWNLIFQWLNVPFSRADITVLLICFAVLAIIQIILKYVTISEKLKTHAVLLFVVFVIISLYYGSGYSESWSYFLLIPIVTSLYGNRLLSIFYSIMGFVSLFIVITTLPISTYYVSDGIDISNSLLLYVIVATFSYLLINKLNMLYNKQVNTVVDSLETTLEQVVNSFVVAMEAKDHYTFGHSERVSKYAVALAGQLPDYQDEHQLKTIRLIGLVHDIGKISIPEDILTKSTPLTKTEFDIIKTHSALGAQMIEKVEGLKSLKSGVLYHHERWDGKGYPTGKKGTDIPIEARILAVADSFDAITSTRPYRSERTFDEAMTEIESGIGTHYDPGFADAIRAVKAEFKEIYSDTHDQLDEFEKLTDFL
ncbi:HD-GYP domain-containing protein [Alkalibacterium thalassium]|uniref:HD domain-containing protein n=1 Tax=Alkalibacterium thalassium TaxID=426701 RepID=A0A1G9A7T4_9LACT|nr:HD-GYP domain-containing protein [Alkalibacterium thalassium]SDK23406.1 HD domain-containing protein [Alkalibacterium thalassium]